MEISLFNAVFLTLYGSWLVFVPRHLAFLLVKYQYFLFKYFPPARLVLKNEDEAKVPVFNERAIRAIGFASLIGAIVILTKIGDAS